MQPNKKIQKVNEFRRVNYNTTIDISTLAKGNILVKTINKSDIATKKIVVQ